MSLIDPTTIEKILPYKRVIAYCIGGIVLLGVLLYGIDRFGGWRDRREIDRMKSNVNTALVTAAKTEEQIAILKGQQAEQLEQANRETQQYLDKINATAEAREETNKALANVAAAKNTNTVGVTVEQLQEKLRRLDQ